SIKVGQIELTETRPLGSGSSTGRAWRMEGQTYLINGRVFGAHDPALQEALARIYGTPVRPRCMCVRSGVETYVSKFHRLRDQAHAGNRRPSAHRPTCPSYEPPASESGLG